MDDINYYSQEFLDFMVDEHQQVISLSIHHNNVLVDKYIQSSYGTTLSEGIQNELIKFTYLIGDELTPDILRKLKNQIVLYQFPHTHTFADTYQLEFMRLCDIMDGKMKIQKLKADEVYVKDTENNDIVLRQFVDKFEETIAYLQHYSNKFRIWIPTEMYLELIKNNHV